uniref:phage tail tape measure protein n=1 Tax=Hafnia paralvei TaxID=546367 RepID=UPI00349FCF0D
MSQKVADIVIGMDVDTATFNQKLSGVSNGLSEVVKKGESDADRMRRLVQEGIARAQGVESASTTAVTQQKVVADALNTRMAAASALVDQAHQQIAQYSKRLKDEAVQTRAVGAAQDKAAQSFFRQIEGVKALDTGLQKLNDIQVQLRQSRDAGNISQGDYLTLLSTTRARVNELTQAENKSQAARVQFLQRLKAQVTQQKLSNTEMLRYKASQLGVADAADIYIRKMEGATKSTQALGLKSAAARRELGVLFGELARGNLGALRGSSITLANRAGWIEQLMSLRGLAIGGVVGGITAAIYGVGKAWYEGSQEAVEFNKQLILTGSYAGKTAGQLQELAKSLSGNGITEHDAAGALAAVIGSGAFKSNQIESVTKAALAMQKATGMAVSETIKNFQRLYQDPTQGSIELNKQLHYLTSAQYEYIASLERRGYKEAAGEVAADAYSKAEQQRSQQVINNLGLIEKTIQKATKRWNQFWDAALNIGRPQTEQYQIEQVNKAINQIYEDRKKSGKSDLFDSGLQKLLFQKKGLEFVIKSQQGYEESQVKAKKADDDRTDSLIYQNQILSKNMSWQQKRAAALTELWQKVSLAPKDWSQEQRNRAVVQINADNKPPKTTKPKAYHDDEATRLLTQYQQKQAQIQGQIDAAKVSVNEKLTESEKQYLALEERISQMKGKTLTAADKSILAHRQALEIALKQNIASEKALNQQNALNALKKKGTQIDLQRQEEALQARQQQALSIGAIGMGDKVRQRYQEELSLRQNYQRQLDQLERDSEVKGTKGTPEYEEVTRKLQASLNERLIGLKSYYAEEDVAQGDWVNGAIRAYQNIAASAGDAAGIGEQAFMSSFNSMSNGLATFVTTGKLNFKSFTASLLSDLAKIMAQMAMMQAVKGVGSALGFGVTPNALGDVYSSSSLSQFSGQIVSRPTYFAFAKGAGVMGEAGPEAILPLRRGSDGKLGVVAAGGQGLAMFAPQYNVNIQNDGSNGQVGPEALKTVYAVGKKAAADFFQQQRRDGGQMSGVR